MSNPVVTLILSWSQTYRDVADTAFDVVADAMLADPTSAAKQLDYKQAVQHHSAVLNDCAAMAIAAMEIIADDASATLAAIDEGTRQLQDVMDEIASAQRVIDVLADLATTTGDVIAAVTTLDLSKVVAAAEDLKTLVQDTVKPAPGPGG